jgi:hypothetical protein
LFPGESYKWIGLTAITFTEKYVLNGGRSILNAPHRVTVCFGEVVLGNTTVIEDQIAVPGGTGIIFSLSRKN